MNLSKIASTVVLTATLLLAVGAHAVDKETILYNFNSTNSGGWQPYGGLFRDQAGNYFGATLTGTIFELSPNGSGGWNYSALLNCSYCAYPFGLVMDQAGNLFGSDYFGNVFEVSPNGSGGWTSALVFNFGGGTDGTQPSPVILDGAGNLYGVNATGGSSGLGYVFELSPNSGGSWTLTHLHDFGGGDGAGGAGASGQVGGLIMDASGNLFGTTFAGGSSTQCASGCGVVFKLKNNSGIWTETVLHSFNGSNGSSPAAPLFMDAAGNLFGTTTSGGASGFGVVFETFTAGTPQTRVLYSFTGVGNDGAYPLAALISDAAGNLYGTTFSGGGSTNCSVGPDNGCGTAFKLTRSGSHWKESILHAFTAMGDGGFPGGLISDASGNLYTTMEVGGRYNLGALIELSPRVP